MKNKKRYGERKISREQQYRAQCKTLAKEQDFVLYEAGDVVYKNTEAIAEGRNRWQAAWKVLTGPEW